MHSEPEGFEGFWDFSVRAYRTHAVQEACLALQTERGADVNLLLFCCWIGATRGNFNDTLFNAALVFSKEWAAHTVLALRRARTWMKREGCLGERVPTKSCMALREKIKQCELGAEKIQQNVLESLSITMSSRSLSSSEQAASAAINLRRYFLAEQIQLDKRAFEQLATIVTGALGHPDRGEVVLALSA